MMYFRFERALITEDLLRIPTRASKGYDKMAAGKRTSKPQIGGSTGRFHEAAREVLYFFSSRDGESCESRKPAKNHSLK